MRSSNMRLINTHVYMQEEGQEQEQEREQLRNVRFMFLDELEPYSVDSLETPEECVHFIARYEKLINTIQRIYLDPHLKALEEQQRLDLLDLPLDALEENASQYKIPEFHAYAYKIQYEEVLACKDHIRKMEDRMNKLK